MTNCDDIGCCRLVHGDAQLTPSGTISMSFRVRTYENDPCVSLRPPSRNSESMAVDESATSLGSPESVDNSTDACSLATAAASASAAAAAVVEALLVLLLGSVGLIGVASDNPNVGILICSRIA